MHYSNAFPHLLNVYSNPVAETIAERTAILSDQLNQFVVDGKRVYDDYLAIHCVIPDRVHELADEYSMLLHLGQAGVLEVLHGALLYAHHHQLERTKTRPYLLKILDVHACMVQWLKPVVNRYRCRY